MVIRRIHQRPLPASFLLIGLLGFASSLVYMATDKLSLTWGMLFIILSIILVAASLRSLEAFE